MWGGAKLIIHIGGPKSGSTSLQRGLFKGLENHTYFGEYGDGSTSRQEYEAITTFLSIDQHLLTQNQVLEFLSVCENRMKASKGKKMIFSSADILEFQRPESIAKILLKLFGSDVSIVLVIRNQLEALASYYSGHGAWLRNVPSKHFRRYSSPRDWYEYQLRMNTGSQLYTFSYWSQLKPFINLFGREKINVFCFEDLVQLNPKTWQDIANLFGTTAEDAVRKFTMTHERRRISRLRFSIGKCQGILPTRNLRKHIQDLPVPVSLDKSSRGYKPRVSPYILSTLSDYYREQNLLLAREFELDLSRHSYPC